ncbi:probable inactive histone-lysine N-methyltransferase SUVR2 isoform X2 [Oryza brachyantha]|uniref:probable inactive histone-lysine N-methyltransferase SUVR2 isoform X2 n=1 Tax=Oryza brachyantha TaxID=4533 RepID=UPI000776A774|nr:probable inactive histone-lysine N-methyltransferase SUVR2 isoform X2 [Oryza brachyantha]
MGSKSNTERARRALDAMKQLGFSKKEATPVLKNLLRLFGNNWEPIEDECYRALADAILDRHQETAPQAADIGDQEDRELGGCSATPDEAVCGGSRVADNDTDEPLTKKPRTNSTDLVTRQRGTSHHPQSPHPSLADDQDATAAISPQAHGGSPQFRPQTKASVRLSVTAPKRPRQMMDEDFQHTAFLKEPKPEPDMDARQGAAVTSDCPNSQPGLIDYPLNASSSRVTLPLALPPPDQNVPQISGLKKGTIQSCCMVNTGKGSSVESMQEAACLNINVASSTMGEVKMSLKCSAVPKFRMPSLEAVFKMVEDKYLHSYKILPPEFSIGSLMNEICQCVVQLGSDHTAEHNTESEIAGNGRSSQNESITGNIPFVKPIACENAGNRKCKSAGESFIVEGSGNSTIANQQPHLALANLKPIHDVTDISKGEERVRISVVNEFASEKCPPSFYYIRGNLVFQNAYVNISVARIGDEDCCADCFGNCLSAPIPCACARETGGEYAYTVEGLVRKTFLDECVSMNRFPEKHHKFFCTTSCPFERSRNESSPEPCRGHLARKFIKECWSKCGCNMQCGNRVVQRGITCNLQVFFSGEGKGWGLRTLDELPKGAFVCEYVGEVLTNTELHERTLQNMSNGRHTFPVLLDADWGSEGVMKDEEALSLDSTFYGNVGRFINHSLHYSQPRRWSHLRSSHGIMVLILMMAKILPKHFNVYVEADIAAVQGIRGNEGKLPQNDRGRFSRRFGVLN